MLKSLFRMAAAAMICSLVSGCAFVDLKLFTDARDPLKEFTLDGQGKDKVVMISVVGFISDISDPGLIKTKPSTVHEVLSQLKLAENDKNVKAILFQVNSPGGTVTGSDILYHEIVEFKKRTGIPVVVIMMDVAASGGYYISMPADYIIAHPTTVTGSIGTVFMRPQFYSLMNKIGVGMKVEKSGDNKDMGSPFRPSTPEEDKLFQALIDKMAIRFTGLVAEHRHPSEEAMREIKTARVFLADDAVKLGLVDKTGYIPDAVAKARELAKISDDSKLVVYRRSEYHNDNYYNTATNSSHGNINISLVDLGMFNTLTNMPSGFYYLWMPSAE